MIFRCSKFRYLIYFVNYALISPLKNCSWEILAYIHTIILENLLKKKRNRERKDGKKRIKNKQKNCCRFMHITAKNIYTEVHVCDVYSE